MKALNVVVVLVVLVVLVVAPASTNTDCSAVSDCSMIATSFSEWWSFLSPSKKGAFIMFFSSLFGGIYIMWHDRKVTAERIKRENEEWLKKYHS